MDLGIQGRVALVTAASRGLGFASALALAQEGCRLVVCARGEDGLEQARQAMADCGAEVMAVPADVTAPDTARALVELALERFGSIDILVGNEGGPLHGRALERTEAELRDALEGTFLSLARLVREAVPHMQAQQWGRICLVTATGVREPWTNMALSAGSRAGLWGWAKALSHELAEHNVTLNTVCPGGHHTERFRRVGSGGPAGDPRDFGQVVAFLCSEQANWVSGVALSVDRGRTGALL